MKFVLSDTKSGKTAQMDIPKDKEGMVMGKRIGDELDGFVVGLDGFKFKITGLSDNTGAPSRFEIEGTRKARPLLSEGPGVAKPQKGYRARRMVRGNTVSSDTSQVNTVITAYGPKPVEELFRPKEEKKE